MLELLGTIFGGIFSGGATGLIGVILQRFADYKNKQLDIQVEAAKQAHELAVIEANAKVAAQEWAARTQMAQVEAAGKEAVADAEAFGKSYDLEPKRYAEGAQLTQNQVWLMVLLDAARGIVRPFLTIYLCALTTYVWYQVRSVLGAENLDTAAALDVWKMVVGNIMYLTTTCVLWWFGTRNKATQPGQK